MWLAGDACHLPLIAAAAVVASVLAAGQEVGAACGKWVVKGSGYLVSITAYGHNPEGSAPIHKDVCKKVKN